MAAKGVSTTAQPLESADYYRLIEYLERDKQYRWALFCIIACTMGLRVSDVKNLTWAAILSGDLYFVDEIKTGKQRRVTRCGVSTSNTTTEWAAPNSTSSSSSASAPGGPIRLRLSTTICDATKKNTSFPSTVSHRTRFERRSARKFTKTTVKRNTA